MVMPQHLLVTSLWSPSSRARQTLWEFRVGKLHPNHLCILIEVSYWITIHFYLVKQFKIESSDILLNSGLFPKFSGLLNQSAPQCFRYDHCVSKVPLFKEMLNFFIHLLIAAWVQFITKKTSRDKFPLGKLYFTPKQLISLTRKRYSGKVLIPEWAPFAPSDTANQIGGKSWNHRSQYLTLIPMARKTWISSPSVE